MGEELGNITAIGTTADAIVAAGAVGSVAAKLRRTTQGLEDLKTGVVLAAGTNLIGVVNPRAEAGAGSAPLGVSVTTTSGIVLAAAATRKCAILMNDSDAVMYLAIGQAAVLNRGIRLNPNGGFIVISKTGEIFSVEAIYGIHGGTGNKVLAIQELT